MARGTMTFAMLGTEPILSSVLAPRLILEMTNCLNFVVDAVDLAENRVGLRRRDVATSSSAEQRHADLGFGMLHHAADTGDETCSSRAAPPTVPVTMIVRITSICRNVTSAQAPLDFQFIN
jgi:hypothetical protein